MNSVAINKGRITSQECSGIVRDGDGGDGDSVGATVGSDGVLVGSVFTKNLTICEGLSIQINSPLSL